MSDERTRAEYYEEHKDDPDEWGEPEPAKPRRRRASMVSVRLAPEEIVIIRTAADERGMSVSEFLRSTALNAAQHHRDQLVILPVIAPSSQHQPGVDVRMLAVPRDADISKIGETPSVSEELAVV